MIKIISAQQEATTFPKLMISKVNNEIVFFGSLKCGMSITGFGHCGSGYYSKTWDMAKFSDYKTTLTLQNEL